MAFNFRNQNQLLRDIAWAVEHDGFDDPLGKSLLRAWRVGAADDSIREMIYSRVLALRTKEAFGKLDPFVAPRLTRGDVILGLDCQRRDVRIPRQWLAAGLLVAANTGSGKSNLLGSLLLQIAAGGCHVWVSDMYKTQVRQWRPLFQSLGRDLIVLRPQDWKFNPLQPGAGNPRGHLAIVIDLLIRRLDLPPRARTILQQGCHDLYRKFSVWEGRADAYPCLFDLYEWVRSASKLNAAARDAILDRLGAFLTALTPGAGAYRVGWNLTDLARFTIDFEMRSTSESVRQILLESTLYAVMQHEVERGVANARIDLFVAFEDSQRFFDSQQSSSGEITPMDELAGVIRGSGKGLGVIVQTMQGLSKRLIPNLATKIMGRLGSHEDYARLGADLAMNAKQIEWARRKLKPGTFVAQVSEGNWRDPFIFSVPLLRLPAVVSDEEASHSVAPLGCLRTVPAREYERWEPTHIIYATSSPSGPNMDSVHNRGSHEDSTPSHGTGAPVAMDVLEYLKSIATSPFLGATERDKARGLSAWKGNRLRRDLVDKELVNSVSINPGGKGKSFQLLGLTDKACDLLRSLHVKLPSGNGRGGLEHQWWCHTISQWLNRTGLQCAIEDDSLGARVDIAIETSQGLVAVEVETSAGHEVQNVRKDLEAGFQRVITLVKDPSAVDKVIAKYEKEFGDADRLVHVGCLKDHREVIALALKHMSMEPG